MALSKLESARETSNLACIARIILCPCTDILQDVLAKEITLTELRKEYKKFPAYVRRHDIFFTDLKSQIDGMENYLDLEIPLIYFFLRCLCAIPPHDQEWGHLPSEKDRSLSANIERIYFIRNQFRHFPHNSLHDSSFEQEWENIFQIVKELEEYIGSGTEKQDTVKKLKTCSMDAYVEHMFIKKLRDVDLSIESALKDVEKTENITAGLQTFEEDREDTPTKKQITSEILKELFNSFKVEFPAVVPGIESFAHIILKDAVDRLVTAIKSLSDGIVLNTQINRKDLDTLEVGACVCEIDVVFDKYGHPFCNFRKGTLSDMLSEMAEDNRIRVFLIRSESLQVVWSKLFVYQTLKHVINKNRIYLQHEYDDFDDVAKLIAYNIFSLFCLFIESVIHAFTTDLHKIMFDYFDKPLTADKRRQICSDVLKKAACTYKPFGSAEKSWSSWVSFSIQTQISEEELTGADAWDEIQEVCLKTVEDLNIILRRLDDFKSKELQVDQKKQIKEWYKRNSCPDRSLLLRYPSIIKFIAGYRNGIEVVKVFLSSNDKKAKTFFMNQCAVWKDAHFEFVNVQEMNRTEENEEIEVLEGEITAVDESNKKELLQIIRENANKLFAKYSNLIGIRVGETNPCNITLYCLDRTIIPFGEQPLPGSIGGKQCYVREDFFSFGTCALNCSNDLLEPGCSIGVPSKQGTEASIEGAGSVGFFYESKTGSKYGSGFITASHVALESCYLLRYQDALMSNYMWKKTEINPRHEIVHPKCTYIKDKEHIVGNVVESFYGKYQLSQTLSEGLDFAVVKTCICRRGEKEILQFVERDKLADREIVTKTGKTTNKTKGYLIKDVMYARFPIPGDVKEDYLPELYIVEDIDKNQRFFEKGDSGSGVFVVGKEKQEKLLGIGIAISHKRPETYVCKIDKVIKALGLTLIRYIKDR